MTPRQTGHLRRQAAFRHRGVHVADFFFKNNKKMPSAGINRHQATPEHQAHAAANGERTEWGDRGEQRGGERTMT